ncbi:MAG: DUF4442 domain-containing protein [Bdellovibrionota bacterium]
MKKSLLLKLLRIYPPYLGAGVWVKNVSEDFREISVEMKLRFWNKNYVGTHFGGSLYSMIDPFYMLMLIENLGKNYIVWDKAAHIRFRRPGRGVVSANFKLTDEKLHEIKKSLEDSEKIDSVFVVNIVNTEGDIVAEVEKTIYISKKR